MDTYSGIRDYIINDEFLVLQLVKVSAATTHAQAGMTSTAPYELVVGVSLHVWAFNKEISI